MYVTCMQHVHVCGVYVASTWYIRNRWEIHTDFFFKTRRRAHFGNPMQSWWDIKTDLEETGEFWSHVAQESDQCRVLVNTRSLCNRSIYTFIPPYVFMA
jgi:hypothetical protein